MKSTRYISRRKFIFYFFSTLMLMNLIGESSSIELWDIDKKLIKEIKNYNIQRKDQLDIDYLNCIQDDLNENKTLWIGKRLYTYAEISKEYRD